MNFENGTNNSDNNEKDDRNKGNIKKLKIVLLITSAYLVVEVITGVLTNSLALISDAGHMFTDAAGIGISLFAISLHLKNPLHLKRHMDSTD